MSSGLPLDIGRKYKIHPKEFMLYLSMASMIMFFSAFCSAVIVKRGDTKHWVDVILPTIFLLSTIVIMVSSYTIEIARRNLESASKFKMYTFLTLFLAIAFSVMQFIGWRQLTANNTLFTGNPSGSFLYMISGMHLFHYVFGILFLLILMRNYNNSTYADNFKLNFALLTKFWHFIGIVWVVLFILFKFLIYN